MAIAFASAGNYLAVPAGTTSWSVPYPTTVDAGDLLVLFISTNGGTVTTPSGWTEIHRGTANNPRGGLWIKVAVGDEDGAILTVSSSSTNGSAQIFRYSGVDTTTPEDAAHTEVANTNVSSTSVVIPAITTVTANTMLIYAGAVNSGSTTITSATGTERTDFASLGGTTSKGGALYDEIVSSTGSTGTRTLDFANRANWAAMLALRPAAGNTNDIANFTGAGQLTATGVTGPPPPRGIISLVGTPSIAELATSSTTLSVPYPATVGAGEFLTAHITYQNGTPPTTTPPTGWTYIDNFDSGSNITGAAYYRVADGTETGSVIFTAGTSAASSTGIICRWGGVDTSSPLDVASVKAISSSALSINQPSQTTVTENTLIIGSVSVASSSSRDIDTVAGWTRQTSSTGTGRRLVIFSKTFPVTGATGSTTWVQNGGVTNLEMAVQGIALRAAFTTGNYSNFQGTGTGTFTANGVQSGSTPSLNHRVVGIPEPTSTVVSVKVTNAKSVRLKVGTNSAVTTGVIYGPATVPDSLGFVKLPVSGLTSGTQYYYRVAMTNSVNTEILDTSTPVGSLRTAAVGQTNFAFNFGSCNTDANAPVYATIAARNDPLFFQLGDLYYADGSGTGIDNFRSKFNGRITPANPTALFATTPTNYTPSDHDGMNNNGAYGNDPPAWINWQTVYGEYFPAPHTYYSFIYGRVLFIQINDRSYKSATADTDGTQKTALGFTQKQWLKDQITNTTAAAIVIAQSAPWITSASADSDGWGGYITERTELANFFSASGKNIVMLAGDMHALAADSGANSPGGIALFHAAPFHTSSSYKGGPYSEGYYPTTAGLTVQQYGRVVVTDTGTQISLAYTGYSGDNTARLSYTKTYNVTPDTQNFTGSATLTGSGTLTATGSPNKFRSVSVSGSGTLTAIGAVGGALLVQTVFTGTNGNAWPAPWSTVSGTSTIQSNRGRQTTPAVAWNAAENRANITALNPKILAILNFSAATNVSQRVNFRWNPATGNGYRLILTPEYNGIQLMKVVNYVETAIQERFDIAWSANTDYNIRVEANGSTLRARRWLSSTTEPTTWDITATDSTYSNGDVSLVTTNTGTAVAVNGTWDDITISELAATPTLSIIPNPERGFFYYTETHYNSDGSGFVPLVESNLVTQRNNGYTLVFRYYVIEKYRTLDTIDQTFLNLLTADFTAARNAGMKLIIRFTYSTAGGMTPPYNADTTAVRTVGHIQQLATVINANADIIDAIQAGFIGMWGEWYYTDNYGDLGTVTTQQWADRKAVWDALMALDSRIFILQRYVGAMRRLLDADPTNTNYINRMGNHNDAFLASSDDYGTYTTFSVGYTEAQNKTWLANRQAQTIHFPQGGESAVANAPRSLYPSAEVDLAAYRFSFLNPIYHPDVIASWGTENVNHASARLGYRLSFTNPTASMSGSNVNLSFDVTNDGWAAPYRNHPVFIDFVSGGTTVTRTLATADTRTWNPGTQTISGSVVAPSSGTYAIYLRVVDPSASLQSNPLYSIQFANTGVFNSANGRNNLGISVTSDIVVQGSGTFTGSGTLTATGSPNKFRSVSLTGSGTLTVSVGAVTRTGSAALSGSGTLTSAVSGLSITRAVALTGSGTLGTQTGVVGTGSASLNGSGTLTTTVGIVTRTGSSSLSGSGQLTAVATGISAVRAVSLSGAGTLTSTATITASRAISLTGSGTLSSATTLAISSTTSLSGSGTLTVSVGIVTRTGSAQLSGTGTLSAIAVGMAHSRTVNLSGTGTLAPSTSTSGAISANLSGVGTLTTVPGIVTRTGTASLTGSGTLATSANIFTSRSVSLTGSGVLSAASTLAITRTCNLPGSGTLTASTNSASTGNAALTGTGSLSTAVNTSIIQVRTFTGLGTLSALANSITQQASAAFTGNGTLNTQTAGSGTGTASLSGSGTLTSSVQTQVLRSAGFTGSGILSSVAVIALVAQISLTGSGTLTATGQQIITRTVGVTGSGTLTTSVTPKAIRNAGLTGSGTLTANSTNLSITRTVALTGSGILTAVSTGTHQTTIANFSGSGIVGFQTGTSGTATLNLSGAGTLAAVGISQITKTVAFTGSGTSSTTTNLSIQVVSTFSGSGTIAPEVEPALNRITVLSGTGTLTTSRSLSIDTERNLSGNGTLTINTVVNPRIIPGTLELLTIKMNSRQYNGTIIPNRFTGSITRKSYPKG